MADLVVQAVFHLQVPDNVALEVHDIFVQDAFHLLVSDSPGTLGGSHGDLTVAETVHLLVSDNLAAGLMQIHLGMEASTEVFRLGLMTLPDLRLNQVDNDDQGQAPGFRINGPEFYGQYVGSTLPPLLLSTRAGAVTSDPLYGGELKIGVLSCSATASMVLRAYSRSGLTLPILTGAGYTGAELSSKLSEFSISMSIVGDLLCRLNESIPGLKVSATGSTPLLMSFAKTLPPLTLSVSESADYTAWLSGTIPPFKITTTGSTILLATLAKNLPPLVFAAGAPATSRVESMTVDVDMPALVMGLVGTGGAADGYSEASELRETGRFTDYSMGHSR